MLFDSVKCDFIRDLTSLCGHVPRQNNKSARLYNATIFFCRKAPLFFKELWLNLLEKWNRKKLKISWNTILFRPIHLLFFSKKSHLYVYSHPRPIERRLVSVFHETEMKIWAGQTFLAARIVLLNWQHFLSRWKNYDFNLICFSNFTIQRFMLYVNFAKGG